MPQRERCPDCQGAGQVEIAGTQHTCDACGGKGHRAGSKVLCTYCKGKGKIGFFRQCKSCNGLGYHLSE